MQKTSNFLLALMFLLTSLTTGKDISIGEVIDMESKIMGEQKTIYVHLPEDYKTSGKSYPVLFQLYSHFTYTYFLPAVTITEQHGMHGKTPKMIVVGIKNEEFRYRDLLPVDDRHSGKSRIDDYLNFFEKELVPYLNKNYRTKNFRILSGPQAGGAFGIYSLSKKPELFNALFLSNPFWRTEVQSILLKSFNDTIKSTDLSNKFVMISYHDKERDEALSMLKDFKKLIDLKIKNCPGVIFNKINPNFDLSVSTDVKSGLNRLFKKYVFPDVEKGQELGVITDYYDSLSRELELNLEPPEVTLVNEGDKFTKSGEINKALKIYKYTFKKYPKSLNAMHRLGTTYMQLKDNQKAIFYFEKFLEIQKGNPMIIHFIERLKSDLKK